MALREAHTYPDGGEPLMVQFVAAWGERSQRSCHLKMFRALRSSSDRLRQDLAKRGGSHAPPPEGSGSQLPPGAFFISQGSGPTRALSTHLHPSHCLLDGGQTPAQPCFSSLLSRSGTAHPLPLHPGPLRL